MAGETTPRPGEGFPAADPPMFAGFVRNQSTA
jgi:hypothetical protein